jgi:hypothetical protein
MDLKPGNGIYMGCTGRSDVVSEKRGIKPTIRRHTVDGRNLAPPWMVETLKIMG